MLCDNRDDQLSEGPPMSARIAATMVMCLTALAAPAHAQPPSPFDQLSADSIPIDERFEGQPKELVAVLGGNRGRHWGAVSGIAYSPDGKLLASRGDSVICLWDAATLRFRGLFPAQYRVDRVAF